MKILTLTVLVVLVSSSSIQTAFAQEESETERFLDAFRPIIYLVIFGIIGVIGYTVRKRRSKSILDAYQIIRDPIISVIQNRFSGSNITFLAVFDTNRLLFIRPNKLKSQPENPTLDDMLKMNKKNFQIFYDDISQAILENSKYGINGARGGKLTIEAQKKYQFDLLQHETFSKCDLILKRFLQDKAMVKA